MQTSKTVITRADHLNPAYGVRRFRRPSIVVRRVLRLLEAASTIPDFLEHARDFARRKAAMTQRIQKLGDRVAESARSLATTRSGGPRQRAFRGDHR